MQSHCAYVYTEYSCQDNFFESSFEHPIRLDSTLPGFSFLSSIKCQTPTPGCPILFQGVPCQFSLSLQSISFVIAREPYLSIFFILPLFTSASHYCIKNPSKYFCWQKIKKLCLKPLNFHRAGWFHDDLDLVLFIISSFSWKFFRGKKHLCFCYLVVFFFFMLPYVVNYTLNCDTWHDRRSFTVLKSRLTCRSLKEKNE